MPPRVVRPHRQVGDQYGLSYKRGLERAVSRTTDLRVVASLSFTRADELSMDRAISLLYESGATVIVCISPEFDLPSLLRYADERSLLTADFAWILLDVADDIKAAIEEGRVSHAYARRLHGLLSFQFSPAPPTRYIELQNAFQRDSDAHTCNASHALPAYSTLMFDAVAALAVALNRSSDPRSSGEVVDRLRQVRIQGASGIVEFEETGDRALVGTQFQLLNFVLPSMRRAADASDAADGSMARVGSEADLRVNQILVYFPDSRSGNRSFRAGGSPTCRCITSFEERGIEIPADPETGQLISLIGGRTTYYPSDYGIGGCEAHDLYTAPCAIPNPPSWCSDRWCYVNPDECTSLTATSLFFAYAVGDLSYSYSTCDKQVDTFADVEWKGGRGAVPVDLNALGCPQGLAYTELPGGARACIMCTPGKAKSFRARELCQPCPAGHAQPIAGAYVCNGTPASS